MRLQGLAFYGLTVVVLNLMITPHPLSLAARSTSENQLIGVNWGMQTSHRLPPRNVVKMLKDNGIQKVKLFEADPNALRALRNSGIEVMVGIPNNMLSDMGSFEVAEEWVYENVTTYIKDNVDIRYVAVGNEAFLKTYNGTYLNTTFPALQNVHSALVKAGLGNQVTATVPLNADVHDSPTGLPSDGDFKPEIRDYVLPIVKYLSYYRCPFTVNIYPFLSVYKDPDFPSEYAFFDGDSKPVDDNGTSYENMFDANYDTLVWALHRNGFDNMPIIVGEIGWPTDGDKNATIEDAMKFNQGFVDHILSGKGTPMRPGVPINAYLFSLIDEDSKTIAPGNFERHWGIFSYDGKPKYPLNLGTTTGPSLVPVEDVKYQDNKWCIFKPKAKLTDRRIDKSMSYACSLGDCTALGYQTSCGTLDARGNISYAFNNYYQMHDQLDEACTSHFSGLGAVTRSNPSAVYNNCVFQVMIEPYYGASSDLIPMTCGLVVFLGLILSALLTIL
ncbi:unnamed protein product [Cuscuta campestris]|uniref:X8 domain-containing protein n=1 Tax=Cuscuta campestris TaxID=132261 RepID=A0A484KHE3_9ASTE|nr:unnamed protein product [Cuscuta campestris]